MTLCPLCRLGERGPGATTITLTRGDSTIVIRQVPAQVCATCGEASIDSDTARGLEQLAEQAIAGGVRYELRDYVQKVAGGRSARANPMRRRSPRRPPLSPRRVRLKRRKAATDVKSQHRPQDRPSPSPIVEKNAIMLTSSVA